MTSMDLYMSLGGPDLSAILRSLEALPVCSREAPARLIVDDQDKQPTPDWIDVWTPRCKREVMAVWGENYREWITYHRDHVVQAKVADYPRDPGRVLDLVSVMPFTVAAFRSIHEEWFTPGSAYFATSFGNLHFPHGWGCAFKGVGHQRLVSRRWLEFGPWRLLRGADDTSLVQFHDLEADPATALEQARPGHERMGISPVGGYIPPGHVYAHKIGGLYAPTERALKIVVHGREVSQSEMLDACAARLEQALGHESPLDRIAYVFMEEEEARRHLHELWLRELECRAIVAGSEVRLDADYHPTPEKPEWVRRIGEPHSQTIY